MQIGLYTLPHHKSLKRMSLLWNNDTDKEYTEAIQELKFKQNDIKQIVIKIEPNTMTYATQKIIEFFMNQHWDRGVRYTHKLSADGQHTTTIAQQTRSAKYKVYIQELYILVNKRAYRLTPQMHIYPSLADEQYAEPMSFQAYGITASAEDAIYQAGSEYAYYKFIMSLLEVEKLNEREAPTPAEKHTFTLFKPLCDAYEIPYDDPAAFEQIDYYLQNRIPITRLPKDDAIYQFLMELGVAPSAEELYDDENLIYIGKESYLESYEEQENDYYG